MWIWQSLISLNRYLDLNVANNPLFNNVSWHQLCLISWVPYQVVHNPTPEGKCWLVVALKPLKVIVPFGCFISRRSPAGSKAGLKAVGQQCTCHSE